jgi:hypothetical protein
MGSLLFSKTFLKQAKKKLTLMEKIVAPLNVSFFG